MYVNMGHNDMAYEDGSNAELSHTFDNEIQNRLIIDGLKWMGNSAKKNRKSNNNMRSPLLRALHP